MTREELLKSPEFWILEIQMKLYDVINEYMKKNKINRKQLADRFGVSKGYISQILNGEFDHKISKLTQLALSVGKVPVIEFEDMEQVFFYDKLDMLDKKLSERPVINLHVDAESRISLSENKIDKIEIKKIRNSSYNSSVENITVTNYAKEENIIA